MRPHNALLFAIALCSVGAAEATSTYDGQYAAVFKGKASFTDRVPQVREIVEQGAITIRTVGDKIYIDVGQIGSVMSATRFLAQIGNNIFTGIHTHPTLPDQTKVVWGDIRQGQLNGRLLYPRVADSLVPGFTELRFQARRQRASPGRRIIGGRTLAPGNRSATEGDATVSAVTDNENKPAKQLKPRQPQPSKLLKPAQSSDRARSIIMGKIFGNTKVVRDIQLVDANENTLATTRLDANGHYRFEGLRAGQYWIYVNDGKAEAYIRTTDGKLPVNANGTEAYRVDFNIR